MKSILRPLIYQRYPIYQIDLKLITQRKALMERARNHLVTNSCSQLWRWGTQMLPWQSNWSYQKDFWTRTNQSRSSSTILFFTRINALNQNLFQSSSNSHYLVHTTLLVLAIKIKEIAHCRRTCNTWVQQENITPSWEIPSRVLLCLPLSGKLLQLWPNNTKPMDSK